MNLRDDCNNIFVSKHDQNLKHLVLNRRLQCDLEMLVNGTFHPLNGFLKENDYKTVVKKMRLECGHLWPIPIVLPVNHELIEKKEYKLNDNINLCTEENLPLAIMKIESIYKPNLKEECIQVFGSDDQNHPYVKIIMKNPKVYYIGGKCTRIQEFPYYSFYQDRLTPTTIKKFIKDNQWTNIIGFQTTKIIHRSDFELTSREMKTENAKLLLISNIDIDKDNNNDYTSKVRCYKHIINYYPKNSAKLCIQELNMRMTGPREAVWHAIIQKNYGCTHILINQNYGNPLNTKKNGNNFYGSSDAQYLLSSLENELGIKLITPKKIVYAINQITGKSIYSPIDNIDSNVYNIQQLSDTEYKNILKNGEKFPQWFTFPEIEKELINEYKYNLNKGFCVYFVGLSGSGKTTISKFLEAKLRELINNKNITVLDGDIVRQNISKGLGFNHSDRSTNIRRIGYIASEIVKHKGICICANIAPFENDRGANRNLINSYGKYFEIFVNTSLKDCEKRDNKGLYKLARAGKIKQFTGINDPFEKPINCELEINGGIDSNVYQNIDKIIQLLNSAGYIPEYIDRDITTLDKPINVI